MSFWSFPLWAVMESSYFLSKPHTRQISLLFFGFRRSFLWPLLTQRTREPQLVDLRPRSLWIRGESYFLEAAPPSWHRYSSQSNHKRSAWKDPDTYGVHQPSIDSKTVTTHPPASQMLATATNQGAISNHTIHTALGLILTPRVTHQNKKYFRLPWTQ